MHLIRLLFILLSTALLAHADVLPPAQDSSSLSGRLTAVTGKTATLAIKATRKGYVQFSVDVLPGDIAASDIAVARLRIYFSKVSTAGDIGLHTVTSAWDETTAMSEPGVSVAPIATIPALTVVGKKFVEVDVTATVRGWLAASSTNHGFAFVTSGATNVLIGAKEGSGSGYPCELEIQVDRIVTDGSIGSTQLASGAAVANLIDGSVPVAKLASSSLTINAGSGLSGGGSVSLGGNVTLSLAADLTLGGTTTGTFSGSGAALTNLPASQINGQLTGTQLASNLSLGGTTTGSFSGDGSALTNTPGVKYNLKQIALLKWADTSINTFSVGTDPFGLCFDGSNVWVANITSNNVTKLNASNGAVIATYNVGAFPYGICFDGANIWVTNQSINSVSKVNAITGAISGPYPVGSTPSGICFDGANIWVANSQSNNVMKLNPSTGALIGTYGVGTNPNPICFDGTSIWVANSQSDSVTKLNPSTGATIGTYSAGTGPIAMCFAGTSIWVTNGVTNSVTRLNPSTGAITGTFGVGTYPNGICFDGTNIWAVNQVSSNVTKLNASTGAPMGTFSVGVGPNGACFDGANIWVANSGSNTVSKL